MVIRCLASLFQVQMLFRVRRGETKIMIGKGRIKRELGNARNKVRIRKIKKAPMKKSTFSTLG